MTATVASGAFHDVAPFADLRVEHGRRPALGPLGEVCCGHRRSAPEWCAGCRGRARVLWSCSPWPRTWAARTPGHPGPRQGTRERPGAGLRCPSCGRRPARTAPESTDTGRSMPPTASNRTGRGRPSSRRRRSRGRRSLCPDVRSLCRPPARRPSGRSRRHPAPDAPSDPLSRAGRPGAPTPGSPRRRPAGPDPGDLRRSQSLRPVAATVTPRPIIASPPTPPTVESRRGERANQSRAVAAARPHTQSEATAMTLKTSPSTSI